MRVHVPVKVQPAPGPQAKAPAPPAKQPARERATVPIAFDSTRIPFGPPPAPPPPELPSPDGGHPLGRDVRDEMERRYGAELGGVRLHTDETAHRAAVAFNARAFTVGEHVYFRRGEAPGPGSSGRRLLLHELAHVVQGQEGRVGPALAPDDLASRPDESVEREARARAADAERADARAPRPRTRRRSPAARRALRQGLSVDPDMLKVDAATEITDPATKTPIKIYNPTTGYIRNPSSTKLESIAKGGKVGGGFDNGEFMYVVDEKGTVWVGKRLGQRMPHPTLIGGKDPKVLAAGMVKIQGGKIVSINDHSGHYKPTGSLGKSARAFMRLPAEVFHRDFQAMEFIAAEDKFKRFRSLQFLKLKSLSFKRAISKLSWSSLRGKWKNPKFRAGAKGVAGVIAGIIISLLLAKWLAEIESKQIQYDIERHRGEMEEMLGRSLEAQADKFDALYARDPNASIYVNIVVRISHMLVSNAEGEEKESYMSATVVSASYGTEPLASEEKMRQYVTGCSTMVREVDYPISEEIPLRDLYEDHP